MKVGHVTGAAGSVTLKPAHVSLAEWRAIYHGAGVSLDPACAAVIGASARTVEAIVAKGEPVYGINTGFGKLASTNIPAADLAQLQRNIVLSHAAGVGEPSPEPIVRLMLALKLASLAQGASGVRPETVAMLEAMLAHDLIPVVPCQGSVGASGDLAPLAHMAAAIIGVGEMLAPDGGRMPAAEALQRHGYNRSCWVPRKGWRCSTARNSRPPMRSPHCSRSAICSARRSSPACSPPKRQRAPTRPSTRACTRCGRIRGRRECAAALQALMAGSAIRASHLIGDDRVQDPYCLRCQPQVMGAALDVLRHAAGMLAIEANGVSDNPLIIAGENIALSGGNFHAQHMAFAADMMALAICEIGSLAERRIAMLVDPALSRLPAFLTPKPGLNSGFMIPQVTAAALVAENRQRAAPASIDSIPTSANQEDHVSMAAHAARRLLPMAENLNQILAIELLAACQGCDLPWHR